MHKTKLKLGILAASSLQMSAMGLIGVVPMAISYFSHANPTTVQTAFTVPMLMSIPMLLGVGIFSSKLGKKIPLIFGISLISLAGLAPTLLYLSLPVFFVLMSMVGLGVGCVSATSTGLIADYFDGAERGSLLGKQSAALNLGGVIITFLGGLLVVRGLQSAFFVFLYAVPILLICLFCVPSDKSSKRAKEEIIKEQPRLRLSREVFILCAMMIFFGLSFGVFNANSALLVVERNLGDPELASFGTSLMAATGIVSGIFYGRLIKVVKELALPLGFALFALALILMGTASSPIVFFIGKIFSGAGMSTIMPTGLARASRSVPPQSATLAISLFLSAQMMANFLSPIIITPVSYALASGTAQSRYIIGFVIVSAISVCALIHVCRSKVASKS
jgi:MFS family permease